jgi:glyoxylase-like metal-dependent hydrolase (beta-lactamase superfamily II)
MRSREINREEASHPMQHIEKIYRVGDVTVTRVAEQVLDFATPEFLYPTWEPEELERNAARLAPGDMDQSREHLMLRIHTWLVRTKDHTILVDTGSGNDKERPQNPVFHHQRLPYLERLAAAGVQPEDVDYVLLTHLHVDHCGFNTTLVDGRWVPTFPNARYVFNGKEEEYYSSPASHNEVNIPSLGTYEDSVAPIVEAGLAERIGENGGRFLENFVWRPTPGHSIGHMSLSLVSEGEEALFAGDLLHHPMQVYRPDWNSVFCEFHDQARASRRWALEHAADSGLLVFTTHLPESSAGRVTRDRTGFSWSYE